MNSRFIEEKHIPLTYKKKEGTKSSFYKVEGRNGILPARLSLGIYAQKKIGSKDSKKKNEINGTYRKAEEGLYNFFKEKRIHTSIYFNEEFPEFYGYGEIDEHYNIFDLVIISSENNCTNSFEIHLFRGFGKPEYLKEVFSYLREYQTKKPH